MTADYVNIRGYSNNDADEITALGKEIWHRFPSLQELCKFLDSQRGCRYLINVITVDDVFAGFVVMLHLYSRQGEYADYNANYVFMMAIKQQYRNHGLGEKLLLDIEKYCNNPIIVSSNPFIGEQFYMQRGYERMPIGWTDPELNQYDMFVKGEMNIDAWSGISERVQELWKIL